MARIPRKQWSSNRNCIINTNFQYKDIKRTFPKIEKFNTKENLSKLKNILLAYSRRNIQIGYVQGFNFIVGRIIQVIPDEVNNYLWLINKFY